MSGVRGLCARLGAAAVGLAWACLMRLEARTWRSRVLGREGIDALERTGERALIAVWHGCYRPAFACVRDWPCVIVSTETFRGRVIRAAARALGHRCVLRPAALRGSRALDWLCETLCDAPRVVLVADGPSGPARRVKRGVVRLAAREGFRLVPCAAASDRVLTRRRWDDQEIPLPFARVTVSLGEPWPELSARPSAGEVWASCDRLAREIDDRRAEALASVGRATEGSSEASQPGTGDAWLGSNREQESRPPRRMRTAGAHEEGDTGAMSKSRMRSEATESNEQSGSGPEIVRHRLRSTFLSGRALLAREQERMVEACDALQRVSHVDVRMEMLRESLEVALAELADALREFEDTASEDLRRAQTQYTVEVPPAIDAPPSLPSPEALIGWGLSILRELSTVFSEMADCSPEKRGEAYRSVVDLVEGFERRVAALEGELREL